ncbi:hypothetical protein C4G69_RS01280 [Vibrio parahaemolyticus]|nr:hypothetical protein [Vibrio parahaemolyticus]EJG1033939.1 hypothetical protein [Vibrio parahaemolyticus]
MNKLKTLLSIAAIAFAANATADCVVTSEYIVKASKKEALPEIGCDLNYYIKDTSLRKGVPSSKANLTYLITFSNQEDLTAIDLSELNQRYKVSLRLENNPNLTTLKLGELKNFNTISLKGSAIKDVRFLENITSGSIYSTTEKYDITENKQYSRFTHFPNDETSNFCKALKSRKVKFVQHKINQRNAEKSCNIERD